VPARGAGIWFIVFIASMMRSVWPSFTFCPTSMKDFAPGEGARYAVPTMGEGTALRETSGFASATGAAPAVAAGAGAAAGGGA
jgi:hypothetical protein